MFPQLMYALKCDNHEEKIVTIFVGHYHLLQDLLNIFIGSFHCAIHPGSVRRRILILDFELSTKFCNHSIVEIDSIVSDDPFGDTIAADEVMFDESGCHILGD